jgi:hypothetical protein
MQNRVNVNVLKGLTLTKIDDEGKSLKFYSSDGRTFLMYHKQDCCESVYIEDIAGNLEDLIGSPILMAEEVEGEIPAGYVCNESCTWTFYKFATIKGYVTIRWLGESNGYYSESVDFEETTGPLYRKKNNEN